MHSPFNRWPFLRLVTNRIGVFHSRRELLTDDKHFLIRVPPFWLFYADLCADSLLTITCCVACVDLCVLAFLTRCGEEFLPSTMHTFWEWFSGEGFYSSARWMKLLRKNKKWLHRNRKTRPKPCALLKSGERSTDLFCYLSIIKKYSTQVAQLLLLRSSEGLSYPMDQYGWMKNETSVFRPGKYLTYSAKGFGHLPSGKMSPLNFCKCTVTSTLDLGRRTTSLWTMLSTSIFV